MDIVTVMDDIELKPLIKDAVSRHCSDSRVECVILDVLHETLQQQYFNRDNWKKYFTQRYKQSILKHFEGELTDE